MSLQVGLVLLVLLGVSSASPCPDGRSCEGSDASCCTSPPAHVKAVKCPDQESECPDETTCCQLPDQTWGCCQMPNAVCCEDQRHCCPEGSRCDLSHSRCVSPGGGSVAMLENRPARRRPASVAVASVTCPGGKSSCPEGTTCCLLTSGDYGCCPYAEAVCCNDHIHCCPAESMCDLKHERCLSGDQVFPLATKTSARPNDFFCPDGLTTCPDQTTCCPTANSSYGCCPMPNAKCCSDRLHCCPDGYSCDLGHSTCVSTHTDASTASLTALTSASQSSSARAEVKVNVVICDESVVCVDGNTCCKLDSGQWACCPLPKAVCCMDHVHCCPHGTICNLAESSCDDARGHAPSLPWLHKLPAFSLSTGKEVAMVTSGDEKCDSQTMCPGGTSCCRRDSGHWACCPLPQAVCCDDQEHCCPVGYRCNLARQTCDGPGSDRLPWVLKTPALVLKTPALPRTDPQGTISAKMNCDKNTNCPRYTTCCFMKQRAAWGCCPLPKAECCADGEHCCPSGYKCDPRTASCFRLHPAGLQSMPWFSKLSAEQQGAEQQGAEQQGARLGDVKCDNGSSCASGTTCCKLATGEWGCCPLVKAVCCGDHEHCCPQGYTCNMHSGTCEKMLQLLPPRHLPQSRVVRSMSTAPAVEEDVPCDDVGVFRCSKQQTCCRTSAMVWACCPSAQAVCCPDSMHCCPAGTSCDLKAGGCTPPSARLRWDRPKH